ncbi:Piso0_004509 [Millerozyma farinosa CBS 7064]|uniref:Kinetochore-associated protein n=1 Tax=Pichia sorbitophila (strain ATCC MYA-4447 / BCRC 22081 / CBS 7064 / NBRC 10061 / NRRL Y-12695) TaxID=559304 RepID=G8Y8Z8_PICSO|nr:Piso0_004509 [Millerozyma farinosa CBS 7064]CCE84943.1 Piso0_004509 [Millerozyma farinosa CBS 7064]
MAEDNRTQKIRYERLRLVCQKALEQSIKKSLSMEQIKKCYPTISSSKEGERSLEIARSQIVKFWHTNSMKEFDLIFKERDIETKLNELDEIVQKAQERKAKGDEAPIEADKLSPTELIEGTIYHDKKKTLDTLEIIYKQLRSENEDLYKELEELGQRSSKIRTDVEGSISRLKNSVQSLKEEDSDIRLDELVSCVSQGE